MSTPGFEFDCSDKPDGNYPHPSKCTHYVACVAHEHAYEMPCAMGHNGELLHYVQNSGPDPATSRCDYPEVAGCMY
ncbi:chitin binding peritrophin-A domain-containing protein [Nocardia sp. NPDC006630]|uniref:chitin binding peritrophin-A domain-containing protein n=1 Tax=Nocardia sp. NPDC006630 TaxID=3157181 RepID=UPI0033AC24D4